MSHSEIIRFLLSLGLLVAVARVLGELARRWRQPAVAGELAAGILLGPTVLGRFCPDFVSGVFPASGALFHAQNGLIQLSLLMFLLMAGLEADLSVLRRRAHHAFIISIGSIVAPFLLGYVMAVSIPGLLGIPAGIHPRVFALLLATAMFISAVPVIARTLMDLGLYRTDLGMITMAVAVFKDVVGWFLFASILGSTGVAQARPIWMTLLFAIAFGMLTLTVGRMVLHGILRWMTRHNASPVTALSLLLAVAFVSGACAEWIGIHALFGAFLIGAVLSTSDSLPEETHKMLGEFVIAFFAPLFFASIGLRVDFVQNFDLPLVLIVLLTGCVGTVSGTTLCARFTGMGKRDSLALGFALNSRGAMEIVLGTLALQYGLISERLFVALVVMALVTSMASGPIISKLLGVQRSQ